MKDFFGNTLQVGDTVAAIVPFYRNFAYAQIKTMSGTTKAEVQFGNDGKTVYLSGNQMIKKYLIPTE